MLAIVAVCSAQVVGIAIGSGGNVGPRWQGRHSERPAVEMVPEYTGTAAQGFGCGACTARSISVKARSWTDCYGRAGQGRARSIYSSVKHLSLE